MAEGVSDMSDYDQERIRERAYALWERAGSPEGDDLSFWIEAERQVNDEPDEQAQIAETSETPAVMPVPPILR